MSSIRVLNDGSLLIKHTTLSGRSTQTAIWTRVTPSLIETHPSAISAEAKALGTVSRGLGVASTGFSGAQTIRNFKQGRYADAALSGTDTIVGGVMLTGPQGAAVGLGYFGTRLTNEAIKFFWPEPSLMEGL